MLGYRELGQSWVGCMGIIRWGKDVCDFYVLSGYRSQWVGVIVMEFYLKVVFVRSGKFISKGLWMYFWGLKQREQETEVGLQKDSERVKKLRVFGVGF